MNLEELIVGKVSAIVPYNKEEMPGFWVEINNLSDKERQNMVKRCTTQKYNREFKTTNASLDEDRYNTEFAREVIVNWGGLKYDYLQMLVTMKLDPKDLDKELAYSEANALTLLKNSTAFNVWLVEALGDLDNFRVRADGEAEDETGEVSN